MAKYAYADETIFEIDAAKGIYALGYGVFITRDEIQSSFIKEAMTRLLNDEEFDLKRDTRTISNGYFHASEDSRNAHSHLCRCIKEKLGGLFAFNYFIITPENPLPKNQQERFLDRCLQGSSLEFFNSLEEVFLVIEGRPELTTYHAGKWQDKIYALLEGSTYHNPVFKTFFPKINVQIGTKQEPGLQVADFMSWAVMRSLKQPKKPEWETWLQRIGFHFTSFNKVVDGYEGGGQCFLNVEPDEWPANYPFRFTRTETSEDLIYGYIIIERFMWHVDEMDFNSDNIHLLPEFLKISAMCKSTRPLMNDDFRLIARMFIRLFDSLPLYSHIDDADKESWTAMFYAKHTATLLIMRGHIHTGRTQDFIQRWRYKLIRDDRQEFLRLMDLPQEQ